MAEHLDNYISENMILRSKLQAKTEALKILAKELDKCREERDRFQLLTEQGSLKKTSVNVSSLSQNRALELLESAREQNKLLKIELERIKSCLNEARKDTKILKEQIVINQNKEDLKAFENPLETNHEKVLLVEKLENLNAKVNQMNYDLQSLLDEKEELIKERDAFKHKAHRVSYELAKALRLVSPKMNDEHDETFQNESISNKNVLIDIDSLISENRFLHEKLQQLCEEKELADHALTKYKSILETKKRKGIVKLGTRNLELIVSHKQVKDLLEKGTLSELPVTATTISNLKSLCLELLDNLSDKTIALSHQKRINKILVSRVNDLEKKLQTILGEDDIKTTYPSLILLENYNSTDADKLDCSDDIITSKKWSTSDNNNATSKNWDFPLSKRNSIKSQSSNDSDATEHVSDSLKLPYKLQMMVEKALEDLKNEKANN